MITTLIFDFDGTVADTYPIIFHAYRTVVLEFSGRHISDHAIEDMFGPPESVLLRRLFPEREDVSAIEKRYYELYNDDHDRLVQPVNKVNRMLMDLKNAGFKLGLFTGKGRKSLDITLAHLFPEHPFEVSVAGDEVKRSKPHPDGVFKVMEALLSTPDESLFIGDSDFDFASGRAAGVKTIGVRWFDPGETFAWKEQPDHAFRTQQDFMLYINTLRNGV